MSRGKNKRSVNDVEETTPPERPPRIHTVRCPSCLRWMEAPPADGVERIITSANPLVRYAKMHEYAGHGSVPEIARRLLDRLCPDLAGRALTKIQAVRIFETAVQFAEVYELSSPIMVYCVVGQDSMKSAAAQLGINDTTVKVIVTKALGDAKAYFTEQGVFPLYSRAAYS